MEARVLPQKTLHDLPLDIVYLIVNHLNYYEAVDFCVAYLSPIYDRFLKENNYSHSIPESKETKVKEFSSHGLFSKCREKLKEIKLTAGYFSTCLSISGKRSIVWGGTQLFKDGFKYLDIEIIKSIVEGPNWAFVIMQNNKIYSFGFNEFGQLGLPVSGRVKPTLVNLAGKEIIKILVAESHTLFLTKDGKVFSCGSNTHGQLGQPNIFLKTSPARVETNEEIIDIAAGHGYSLMLTKNGELLVCGLNDNGQIGQGEVEEIKKLVKLKVPGFVIQVSAGIDHTLFLNAQGEVYFCGSNENWAGGALKGKGDYFVPIQIESLKNKKIVSIAAGIIDFSLFLTADGEVYKLGRGCKEPTLIELPEKIFSISAGFDHAALLSRSGKVYTFGANECGQLGYDTNGQKQMLPRKVELIAKENKKSEENNNNNNNNNKRQRLS